MRNLLRSSASTRIARLEAEVAELQDAVEESRRLNERLSDVLDVVTELLVPAVDRDDARLQQALDALQASKQRAT
jgi:NTP pyrophosphatase (non-canonical NTP hydrolase)